MFLFLKSDIGTLNYISVGENRQIEQRKKLLEFSVANPSCACSYKNYIFYGSLNNRCLRSRVPEIIPLFESLGVVLGYIELKCLEIWDQENRDPMCRSYF